MNTLFHTKNYYQKILIQYIFLSYTKNDLVKLGESILDYIEFLIKFKFKSSSNEKEFLNFNYRYVSEYQAKQNIKKKTFDKIIDWFELFSEYISFVKANSTLDEEKNILEEYSKRTSDNKDFNFENPSTLMFRINIQRFDFLKGKFSLYCKNYNDALFYFIRAAKKKNIIIDGLIKKRSLKHIYKITLILKEKFQSLLLKNLYMEKKLKEFQKHRTKIYDKKLSFGRKYSNKITNVKSKKSLTFGEEIENIKLKILECIDEFKIKQKKDILILIDLNLYNNKEDNIIYILKLIK